MKEFVCEPPWLIRSSYAMVVALRLSLKTTVIQRDSWTSRWIKRIMLFRANERTVVVLEMSALWVCPSVRRSIVCPSLLPSIQLSMMDNPSDGSQSIVHCLASLLSVMPDTWPIRTKSFSRGWGQSCGWAGSLTWKEEQYASLYPNWNKCKRALWTLADYF